MRNPAFWLITLVATLCLTVGIAWAQEIPVTNLTVLVNRDDVNVRLLPAIGAEVLGFVDSGYTAQVYARSPDNEWVRVRFSGEEGWIGMAVLTILSGDLNSVPVADPRTIPYGGFESPRAGLTSASSPIQGVLNDTGVRVRAGPSRAYPVLADAPRRTQFSLLGRTYNNAWYQVNFEGTLGWVTAQAVTLMGEYRIPELPVDGIVAESLPVSDPTSDDYFGTLRLIRDRINLAQPSLDQIRAIWTDIALGGRAACSTFPPRPSDYNVPNPLLAAFYVQLNPLQADFNAAMANLRAAIDILLEACRFAQPPAGSVGQATVQNALAAVNEADRLFAEVRRQLAALLPNDLEPGANECLLLYRTAAQVLPLARQNVIYVDHFAPRRTITGYCFDATLGEVLLINTLPLTENLGLFFSVSPADNPTNFLAAVQGTPSTLQPTSAQVTIPATGRYLLIINDITASDAENPLPPTGDFAFLIFNPTQLAGEQNAIDITTGEVALGYVLQPIVPASAAPVSPVIQPTIIGPGGGGVAFCPGLNLTCSQLTCDQARACLQAGNFALDGDNDRIACEENGCVIPG